MTAKLTWHDDQQSIIRCTLTDDFGIENYAVMEGQLPMMVREVEHRVDVIFYLTDGAGLPPLQGFFQELGIILNVMPPNFGMFVGVADGFLLNNPLSLTVARQFIKVYYKHQSKQITVASSLENAVSLIQLRRASH